ncbi:hypothetical protein MKX03_006133, partial [Papaver bracteatum]
AGCSRSCRKKKRPTVKWTIEEEAMLKALLLQHMGTITKFGPWEDMLLEGRHVFKSSRTASDLKDKWRNALPH